LAGAAFHVKDGVTVLFGGSTGAQYLGDTWEFDGTSWTQIPVSGPIAQPGFGMTYDPIGERIIGFGNDTTWAYGNHTWTQLTVAPPSSARAFALLAFAPDRQHVIMYGGRRPDETYLNDTWELISDSKGDRWAPVQIAGALPEPGRLGGLVGDPARGDVILFGGQATDSFLGDTLLLRYRSSVDEL
jgi:hypothetical protein